MNRKFKPLRALLLAVLALLVIESAAWAQQPDPARYLQGVMRNPRLRNTGTGEGFTWHARSAAEDFLDAYEAYQNPEWLAKAVEYYSFYLAKLQKDPDGYEGWIGDPISKEGATLATDTVVGDALLSAPLVRFAEIVYANPELKARFGAKADEYVALATRICWEKFNKRGQYYEDTAGWGSYHTHNKLIDVNTNKWVEVPSNVISDNLNKHYTIGVVIARLYRVTGKPEYRERVLKVFGRAKQMMRYLPDEDRVVWNFWMPHGPYDIAGRAPRSWVAVHPSRPGYQAGEVGKFLEIYDTGLVFDQQDFERMIRTNHFMNQNGKWRSADDTSDAGTLWSALARFDEKIRTQYLSGLRGDGGQISRDYLAAVMKKAPGWKRRYVSDESKVEVVNVPMQPGRHLTMSQAIPDLVETASEVPIKLACQTRKEGTLKIELLSADGKEVLGTLREINVGKGTEYNAPFWDGTNPKTGNKDLGQYTVRWTLGDESRVAPVWVKVGQKRESTGPAAMAAGQTLKVDFEQALDQERWSLDGASVSDEQVKNGSKALKIERTATLRFGEFRDLPVKITMWVHDSGAKFGKGGAQGPAWGVVTAEGDQFCVVQMWRPYLSGDTQYSWVNTGENQWFSPHPSRVNRKEGWNLWTFDFTDPAAVKISSDSGAVSTLSAKFTPKGAVGIYLLNGKGGPLYIDDITVEYPEK